MTDRPKLSNPRVHVVMMDGAEWDAQTYNPDLLAYERTATKHKWPPANESPVQWMTFVAWKAGLREGHLAPGVTWEAFSADLCAEVTNPDARAGAVDPTQPEVGTD